MQNEQFIPQIVELAQLLEAAAQIDFNLSDDALRPPMTEFAEKMRLAKVKNPWFTFKEQQRAFYAWSQALNTESLTAYFKLFPTLPINKTVAIIAAGNIPLVGFHDVFTALCSGSNVKLKTSSDDDVLLVLVLEQLLKLIPAWKDKLEIVERLQSAEIDALIATGSDNTSRYFEYYFREIPKIIRKNRTSIAVLTGQENELDLLALGEDIFAYYGLGCRNVTKLFVPEDFDVQRIFKIMPRYEYLEQHNKYMNNYTYHKAIYLMNQDKYLENSFVLLRESEQLHSPISCIFYERYSDYKLLRLKLDGMQDKLQCQVGKDGLDFGVAQKPTLTDFADKVNTIDFLAGI